MVAVLPPEFPTGSVVGKFLFLREDGTDAATRPDTVDVFGKVKFTASVPRLQYTGAGGPALAVPLVFRGKINANGVLEAADGTGVIELPATDSNLLSPKDYTWHVEFDLCEDSTGNKVKIPAFDFQVPEGTDVDLPMAVPVATSPGVITIRGPQGEEGPAGPPGAGVPAGGASLQYLRKNSGNTGTEWATPTAEAASATPSTLAVRDSFGNLAAVQHVSTAAAPTQPSHTTRKDYVDLRAPKADLSRNVRDYYLPADGTDWLPAFTRAIDTGGYRVFAPKGTYMLSSAVLLKDNTELVGDGIDRTILKLMAGADQGTWVVTNADRLTANGNVNLRVADMTLDWDIARLGGSEPTGTGGGSRSSCLTYGNVHYSRVERVKSINAGLHGFDITCGPIDYPYNEDMPISNATGKSTYVWIDNCEASNFGDDAFTTHHSEYLFISNSYGHSPRKFTNNNAFEIDDGSRFVTLTNNTSRGCYAGIEIKAHGNAPAGQGVVINGHIDYGSVRSYNWRHIGHHTPPDPVSLSAFDIVAANLVSIYPQNMGGQFQDEATPRALVIGAFRNVSVSGLLAIGNNNYTVNDAAVAVQFMSENILLSGLNIRGFGGAGYDISITSADFVTLNGVNISGSAAKALYVGSGPTIVNVASFIAKAPTAITPSDGLTFYSAAAITTTETVKALGYANAVSANGGFYPSVRMFNQRAYSAPAGITAISQLTAETKYYFGSTFFGTLTDIPTGETGSFGLANESISITPGGVKQTLTKYTTAAGGGTTYYRMLNSTTGTAGPWHKYSVTLV